MSTRKPLVAANWKMHKTAAEAVSFVEELLPLVAESSQVCDLLICPSFTNLIPVAEALVGSAVHPGAQDMHWEEEGAFTGAVSASMILTSGGVRVILGHSERRQLFRETNDIVNRKLAASIRAGLKAIVCVGETLEEREAGQIEGVVLGQVEAALNGITSDDTLLQIAFAYEPIWAIGTGRTATPEQANEVHQLIRNWLRTRFGSAADAVAIQYGGSVKPENADDLFAQEDIDGGLIGGASLNPKSFAAIATAAVRQS